MEKGNKKLFYGWVIVFGCVLLTAASGIISSVMGVFIKPISEALGVSRSAFSLYATFLNVTVILIMPFVPTIYKKYPFKRLLTIAAILSGIGILLFSFASQLWMIYAVSVLIGASTSFLCAVPIVIMTSNWFVEKRGAATSIAFAGMGISSMILSPVAAALIERFDWQIAYRVLCAVYLLLMIPAIAFFVCEKPSMKGLQPLGYQGDDKNAAPVTGFTRAQTVRTKSFWLFGLAIALLSLVSFGMQQHAVSLWTDIGYTPATATLWFSVMMGVGIISKASFGAIYDKHGIRKASAIAFGFVFFSILAFCLSRRPLFLILAVVLFGLGSGVQIVPPTFITNKLFGDRDYSANYGLITAIYYVGMSVGVPLSAFSYDTCGSYLPAWGLYAVLTVATLVLIFRSETVARKERFALLAESEL